MAKYRLLTDHYVGDHYLEAGAVVTEGVEIPVGWPPSLSVDPLDGDAAQKFWNQMPGPLLPETFAWPGGSRFDGVSKPVPATYWRSLDKDTAVLTGIGTTLGPRLLRPLGVFVPPTPSGDGTLDFSLATGANTGLWALFEDI